MRRKRLSLYLKLSFYVVICMWMGIWVTSCIAEDAGVFSSDEEDVYVTLQIYVPGTDASRSRSLTSDDEVTIKKSAMKVLVFDYQGRYLYAARISQFGQIVNGSGTITVELEKSEDANRQLVLIANAGTDPTHVVNEMKSTALAKYTFNVPVTGFPNAAETVIPMCGESVFKTITEKTNFGTISLRRAVARIDVGVNIPDSEKETDSNGNKTVKDYFTASGLTNFKLTSIRLYNSLDKGYVTGDGTKINETGTVITQSTSVDGHKNYVPYTITGGKQSHHDIYLSEVSNHLSDGGNKQFENRCCLVIGGKYSATGNVDAAQETFYRIDFLEGKTDDTLLDIVRNHRYVFNIKKVGGVGCLDPDCAFETKSINLVVEITDWEQQTLHEIDYNGQDNFQCETKHIILGYQANSKLQLPVKSNVPASEWLFVDADGNTLPNGGGSYSDAQLTVTKPAGNAKEGTMDFTALKTNGITGEKKVYLRVHNLIITFIVTQIDDAINFDPELNPSPESDVNIEM